MRLVQRLLPLYPSEEPDITYTALIERRKNAVKEPATKAMLTKVHDAILDYEKGDESALATLNELSVELSVLHPTWLDFSVECFIAHERVVKRPLGTTVKELKKTFTAGLKAALGS